ncbi:unnamed protein product [Linum trigynum]|uniref:Gnk2-homologous domain-containing protein n=1 Tax=Linum trigynum TaxID=586398 RepID=A0AAV2DNN3_9ROSI
MGFVAAGALALLGVFVIMNTVAVSPAEDVILCNTAEFTDTTTYLAVKDALWVLQDTDGDFLRNIDENVYSPTRAEPIAFGKRVCEKKNELSGVAYCENCFREAYSSLVNCWTNNSVGGQVTHKFCSMRYEIYNFLSP